MFGIEPARPVQSDNMDNMRPEYSIRVMVQAEPDAGLILSGTLPPGAGVRPERNAPLILCRGGRSIRPGFPRDKVLNRSLVFQKLTQFPGALFGHVRHDR